MSKVVDMYGTELECGDMACTVLSSGKLHRAEIRALVSDKTGDYVLFRLDGPKVKASRIIKCY